MFISSGCAQVTKRWPSLDMTRWQRFRTFVCIESHLSREHCLEPRTGFSQQ